MIVESSISETLLSAARIKAPGSPSVEVTLPFQPFSPEEGQEYVEAIFLPNVTQELFVGNETPKGYQGFLQLSVMWPDKGQGDLPARDLASEIAQSWRKGTALDGSGFRIKVPRAPSIAQTMKDGAWLRVPVSIPYQVIA